MSKERDKGRKWDGVSRISTNKYKENWEEIYGQREQEELNESMKEAFRQRDERIAKEKKKKGSCGCGRSPTGLCIGWHSLTEDQYKEKKINLPEGLHFKEI